MSELFDPNDLPARQKEKVTLSNGRYLWVWDMDAASWLQGTERAIIRSGPRAGQQSVADLLVWRVMVSCYSSEGPEARRLFSEQEIMQIYRLPSRDFQLIIAAMDRVNGTDPETGEAMEAFTPLREEEPIET